jgi:hypothetical protein
MTMLLSPTGDGASEATLVMMVPRRRWPWCDVDTESCWQQCCRVMLAMTLLRQLGHGTM